MNDISILIVISAITLLLSIGIVVLIRRLLWLERRHGIKLKIEAKLHFIINKLENMPTKDDLQQIKDQLTAANQKVDRVAADVQRLHDQITAITGDLPTQEEWDAVKAQATDLNTKLQAVDDQTAE